MYIYNVSHLREKRNFDLVFFVIKSIYGVSNSSFSNKKMYIYIYIYICVCVCMYQYGRRRRRHQRHYYYISSN